MNKIAKGSIAAAAGLVLLMGGVGTFALWNESITGEGGTVATGNMDLALVANSAAWADISTTRDGDTFDPTADTLVPGDTVTFEQKVTVTAWGKNLRAEFGIDPTSYTIDAAVANDITVDLDLSQDAGSSTATVTRVDDTNFTIDPNSDYAPGTVMTFTALVTITFDGDNTTGATGSTGEQVASAVVLDDLSFNLVQVRP